MKLHELQPALGSTTAPKRLGRGVGSQLGKTSGKGHKGAKARSGGGKRVLRRVELRPGRVARGERGVVLRRSGPAVGKRRLGVFAGDPRLGLFRLPSGVFGFGVFQRRFRVAQFHQLGMRAAGQHHRRSNGRQSPFKNSTRHSDFLKKKPSDAR